MARSKTGKHPKHRQIEREQRQVEERRRSALVVEREVAAPAPEPPIRNEAPRRRIWETPENTLRPGEQVVTSGPLESVFAMPCDECGREIAVGDSFVTADLLNESLPSLEGITTLYLCSTCEPTKGKPKVSPAGRAAVRAIPGLEAMLAKGSVTRSQVREELGIDGATALSLLCRAGRVVRRGGTGKAGDPYRYETAARDADGGSSDDLAPHVAVREAE